MSQPTPIGTPIPANTTEATDILNTADANNAARVPEVLLASGDNSGLITTANPLQTAFSRLTVNTDSIGTQAQISEVDSVQEPSFAVAMIWPMVGPVAGGYKTLVFQITTAFTMAAQQPTIQFFIGRSTSGQNDADHPLIGAAQTLTAAGATSIPVGSIFWDADAALAGMSGPTVSAIAQLRHPYAYWGAKVTFPVSAPTAGAAVLYVDSSGV